MPRPRVLCVAALAAVMLPSLAAGQPWRGKRRGRTEPAIRVETRTTVDDSARHRRAQEALERAWRAVGYMVRDPSLSTRRRLTAVVDFLERFGVDNPHASNAERYREALELGHEPAFRVPEGEACVDPTLPGDEAVDATTRGIERRRARIAQIAQQARRMAPPGSVALELRLAELHRRDARAAKDEAERAAARARATEILQDILQEHGDFGGRDEARYLLLIDHLAAGATDEARAALAALTKGDPDSPLVPYASFALGRHEARAGRWAQARAPLERARRAVNEDLAHAATYELGLVTDALGSRDEARLALRRLQVELTRRPQDNARLMAAVERRLATWRRSADPASAGAEAPADPASASAEAPADPARR